MVQSNDNITFKNLYSDLQDDDEITFIVNSTFETIVDKYLKNNHFILLANVINHFPLSAFMQK